jgi:hypothetical protein
MRRTLLLALILGVALPGAVEAQIKSKVLERTPTGTSGIVNFEFTREVCEVGENCGPEGSDAPVECSDCKATLIVKRGEKVVLREKSEGELTASYFYTCDTTGLHTWTVTYHAGSEDTVYRLQYPSESVSGNFRIAKCGKERPRRIARGTAQRKAASLYPSEFVSRNRCAATAKAVRGRAAEWECQVTRNNSYRECESTIYVSATRRVVFGQERDRTTAYSSGARCRDY